MVGNGDTGLALVNASEVRITGTTVFGNGALRTWGGEGQVPSKVSRRAGGVVLWGNPPPSGSLEFSRNRIYANRGNQVLALGTSGSWTLDNPVPPTAGCGSDAEGPLFGVISCYDPEPAGTAEPYRGLVAVDASVSAKGIAWQSVTPSETTDFRTHGTGATIVLNPWCPPDPTLDCGSEYPAPQ